MNRPTRRLRRRGCWHHLGRRCWRYEVSRLPSVRFRGVRLRNPPSQRSLILHPPHPHRTRPPLHPTLPLRASQLYHLACVHQLVRGVGRKTNRTMMTSAVRGFREDRSSRSLERELTLTPGQGMSYTLGALDRTGWQREREVLI